MRIAEGARRTAQMAPMRVLVSGAGVAGNTLAFWLSRLGHNVTVVERFPHLRTTGLQVDLRGHGVEVLRRMGLEAAFLEKKAPEQGIEVVDKAGRRKGFFPANRLSPGGGGGETTRVQNFTSDYEIMRGDLCRLLHDAAKESRTAFAFGRVIETFTDEVDGVHVKFSDGTTGQYDLVVGGDGQRSSIRRSLFGQDVEDASYHPFKDTYMAYFTIPRPIQPGEEYVASLFIATGRRGLMTRRHSKDELQVYMGYNSHDGKLEEARRQGGLPELKKAWADIFQGAGWKTDEILRALQDTDADIYVETPALVKLNEWSRGRVALVGDAAWCPTPSTGVGTTCAMIGAYVLAGEIARHCGQAAGPENGDGLAAALKAYQEKFMPYMAQIQKGVSVDTGADGLGSRVMASSFGIWVMHLLVSVASGLKINLGRWFLKETEMKGWDLDEYKAVTGPKSPPSHSPFYWP